MLLGVLASACSAGVHSTASRPTYLAQAALTKCEVGEPSMNCCIKKFPLTPAESCGATAADIADALEGAKVLNEATQATEPEATKKPKEEGDPDEGYRQHCIDMFVLCQHRKWTGNCHDCLRYCQGQKQWPFHLCGGGTR